MKLRIFTALAALLLAATAAQADSLSVGLDDDSAHLYYQHTLNQDEYGSTLTHIRGLYSDDRDTTLVSAGVDFLGGLGNVPGLEAGVGLAGYFGETGDIYDYANLALVGRADYAPPVLQGVGFGARIAHAPQILSYLDSDRLTEFNANVSYAITPKVRAIVSYQTLRVDFERAKTHNVDKGFRFGFAAQF